MTGSTAVNFNKNHLDEILHRIGPQIADNGKLADATDTLSQDNYRLLREARVFSAMVPGTFGGGDQSFPAMCEFLRSLAKYHPSTALSVSMHQHIVAANIYNHRHGRPGKALLEKVAGKELVLISTGAGDWLASTGSLEKVEGGYLMNATKHFASGSPAGDVLVTSAPYHDPVEGWQVFHFPVSTLSEGVTILDNWAPMGMRGSGSNSVTLENVFIPEESIAARRPRGDYHMMWSVILPVALPLIMSVYRGIAELAAEKARERCKESSDPVTPYILGEMENALTVAQLAVDDMIKRMENFNYEATLETVNEVIKRKTIAAEACKRCAAKAVEACGGPGFLRAFGIESLLRDVTASHFHPMQEKRQHLFTGSLAMGNEPPSQAF
ncbi:acyl-CoA dehydrogenase family protein [Pseudomaricurvus sp. HS19]|uniref:acyl-CoA dehydrogenase family protein n=1 Tax=Pseudomaricurvus sp. HS19 TaxID=2692626 RepID=UPI00136C1982|nr:acyl-CoA dehydrogenase family protein [Pseudomaricurvus sp. HS19]MYM64212.1 acyl-CoA dehydrogenase [Pseudomaricurvus sp. HS19]